MLQARRSRVRIPVSNFFFFNLLNPSSRTMALGFIQRLREMGTRNLPCGGIKRDRRVRLTTSPPSLRRLGNMGSSTSHNVIGLYGLLKGKLYFLLTGLTAVKLKDVCLEGTYRLHLQGGEVRDAN
jgi:hypothetical protein